MDKDKLKEQFKCHSKDTDELRRRRLEGIVELRKANKDDQMSKRRGIEEDECLLDDDDIVLTPQQQQERVTRINAINQLMSGPDPAQHLAGLKMAHEFLKTVRPRPIEVFVTHGVLPKLVEYLKCDAPEIQYEAAWVLTTLAFGNHEQTLAVVEANAIDPLLKLFDSPDPRIADQAVWCIGNISGDGPELQHLLFTKGLVPKLVQMSKKKLEPEQMSNVVWALANMSEDPKNTSDELLSCLKVFTNRLYHKDILVVREAARGISMLSSKDEWLNEIYESNMLQEVSYLLESDDWRTVKPCLKIMGHFAAGNDTQAQYVIDAVALPAILQLMKSPRKHFMKEATRTLGNIACGTFDQVLAVLNTGLAPFVNYVLEKGEKENQLEALYLLQNITALCKMDQLIYLQKHGVVSSVCNQLKNRSNTATHTALKVIHNVLRIAAKYEELEDYLEYIEEAQGLEHIEALENNPNDQISNKASYIIEKYFNGQEAEGGHSSATEEDDEEEMGSGDAESMGTMSFNVPMVPQDVPFDFE